MSAEAVIRCLRSVLEGRGLRLAVLFGSAARGALRSDSDVDVGILPGDPELALQEELALQAALEKAAGRRVDLVQLDRASVLLRWRVAREVSPALRRAGPRERAQASADALERVRRIALRIEDE